MPTGCRGLNSRLVFGFAHLHVLTGSAKVCTESGDHDPRPAPRPAHRRVTSTPGRPLRVLLLLAALAGCGRQHDAALAAHGEVDAGAPIRTSVSVAIKAPPALVWTVLSDIARWPSWQPDIEHAAITEPVGAGTRFRWTTSGGTIHSRIVLFEPEHRLAWIGRLLMFRAIHVWTLASLPDGDTEVTTTETLSGWPIALFYSSDDLRQADQRWLDALRQETERHQPSSLSRN